jgi:hypothetical protein
MKQIKIENISEEEFVKKNATKTILYEIVMRITRENFKLKEENEHLKSLIEILKENNQKTEEKKPPQMIITRYKNAKF